MGGSFTNQTELNIRRKLSEAFGAGRFFVAITYVDPLDGNTLQHFYATSEFPSQEVQPSLAQIFRMFKETNDGYQPQSHFTPRPEPGRRPDNEQGSERPETFFSGLDDRRPDSVPGDLGEQPEPDSD